MLVAAIEALLRFVDLVEVGQARLQAAAGAKPAWEAEVPLKRESFHGRVADVAIL
jgi:hypothetical protein